MSRQTRLDWFSSRKTGRPTRRSRNRRQPLGVQPLEARRLLAVITVDTIADTIDFNDGQTSLREAVFAANTVPGADTIEFADSLYENGPATILLTLGEIAITDASKSSALATGSSRSTPREATPLSKPPAPARASSISTTLRDDRGHAPRPDADRRRFQRKRRRRSVARKIRGRWRRLRKQPGTEWRSDLSGGGWRDDHRLAVSGQRRVCLRTGAAQLVESLQAGQAILVSDSQFSGNSAGQGGAIAVHGAGAAFFERVTVLQNVANSAGGGISIGDSPTLQVTIRDSVISGNKAMSRGAGISAMSTGSLAIENSTLSNNDAPPGTRGGSGGGAYFSGSNVSILGSTISGNGAGAGGGLFSRMGELSIRFSEVSDNQATTDRGGGFYSERSRLSIVGSEITGNSAAATRSLLGGGGIWMSAAMGANAVITDTRIEGNSAAMGNGGGIEFRTGYEGPTSPSLVLTGVTVANNSAISGGGVYVFGPSTGQLAPSVQIMGGAITGNKATSAAGGGLFSTLPNLQIDGTVISKNTAWGSGGGIAVPSTVQAPGQITIANATFQENIASAEFNGPAAPGDGGAVWVAAPAAIVNVSNSQFTNNAATRGGAIFVWPTRPPTPCPSPAARSMAT